MQVLRNLGLHGALADKAELLGPTTLISQGASTRGSWCLNFVVSTWSPSNILAFRAVQKFWTIVLHTFGVQVGLRQGSWVVLGRAPHFFGRLNYPEGTAELGCRIHHRYGLWAVLPSQEGIWTLSLEIQVYRECLLWCLNISRTYFGLFGSRVSGFHGSRESGFHGSLPLRADRWSGQRCEAFRAAEMGAESWFN